MKRILFLCLGLGLVFSGTGFAQGLSDSEALDQLKSPNLPSPVERPARPKEATQELALMAVQSGGRLKPLDTLARETIRVFHNKDSYGGRAPVETLLSLLFNPRFWENHDFIYVGYLPLKRDLGLDKEQKYFSLASLRGNEKLIPLFQALQNKEQAEEKLDDYFQAVSRLRNQFNYFSFLVAGKIFTVVPPAKDSTAVAWRGLDQLPDALKMRFWLIAATFENGDPQVQARAAEKAREFISLAMAENPDLYPSRRQMEREVHFNNFHPFRWAWILGLVGIVLLGVALVRPQIWVSRVGMLCFMGTLAFQVYGFYLRVMIAGRPPVTNMYESVIWVAFGCMVFGFVIEFLYRKHVVALAALGFAVLCLIMADTASTVLDASIHPLQPVLRSNFWLLIHVLTITLGYAAFALSLAIGNLALAPIVFLQREGKLFPLKEMALYAYRAVQVGVVLLGAGTILGGVWAAYSWGRFWGWDPKETWALIAFLGYVAVIHARIRGMLRDFGFLAASIISFLLVVMAWYGVNFWLGAGLHSYGFSSGGNVQMFVMIAIQGSFVAYAMFTFRRMKASPKA